MGIPEDALKHDLSSHRHQHGEPADLEGPGIVPERHVIPEVALPNVAVLAIVLTSLHVLEDHLCGLVLDVSFERSWPLFPPPPFYEILHGQPLIHGDVHEQFTFQQRSRMTSPSMMLKFIGMSDFVQECGGKHNDALTTSC